MKNEVDTDRDYIFGSLVALALAASLWSAHRMDEICRANHNIPLRDSTEIINDSSSTKRKSSALDHIFDEPSLSRQFLNSFNYQLKIQEDYAPSTLVDPLSTLPQRLTESYNYGRPGTPIPADSIEFLNKYAY